LLTPALTSRFLPVTIILLFVLGVCVPLKYLGWARPLGWLATTLVAPISHPFAAFSRWVAPAETSPQTNEEIIELNKRLEEAERAWRSAQLENKRLMQSLEELKVMSVVNSSPVRQVFAPIFGSSSDLSSNVLRARAGRFEGVDVSSVATAAGLQLLGRVISVDERTCDILPFNAKGGEAISAMIMIDASANGLVCRLTPTGSGTLKGPVKDQRDPLTAAAVEPTVGQTVRLLADGVWPQSAQMLLVGKVIAIEPSPDGPLRKIVTVQPTIERLDRVSEVVIRTNAVSDDENKARRRK